MSLPRLLPITIMALAALLAVRGVVAVRAIAQGAAADSVTGPAAVTGAATANGAPPPVHAVEAGPAPTVPASDGPLARKPEQAPVSEAERSLLQDLRDRRASLDARETALATREAVAAAAEKRLAVRLDELTALQKRLESLEAARRDRDEAGWRGLVRVYEAMRPKEAAVIFNDLDMPVLLQVVDRMKEAKAAPVLAAMLPDRARQLTSELSQMRANANRVPDASPPAAH